jgi:L-amino acid N-acyltransferase YncA
VSSAAISVREATPDDAAAVVAILNPIIAARIYTVFEDEFSVEAEREFIAGFPPRGIFHLAVDGSAGAIVGFQTFEPYGTYTRAFHHVGIAGTFVALNRRRQGIATRLFEATFAAAVRKGYEKAFTFVRADNPAALEAYVRHGFRIIGRAERHAKIDGKYVDELLIEKQLKG